MRGPEATGGFQFVVTHIHRNNLAGPKGFSDLDDVGTHTAGANHRDRLIGLHSGLVLHGAIGRHHGTAKNAGIRQGYARRRRKNITGRDHGVLRQPTHTIHG